MRALITASTKYRILANMCRYVLTCFFLLLLGSTAAYCGSDSLLTPEEQIWFNENQTRIVLAFEDNYAPFSFLDANKQPAGLTHDYMELVEAKLGVKFHRNVFPSLNELLAKVRGNEHLFIVNALTNTPQRAKYIAFTDPYIEIPNVIIVQNNRAGKLKEISLSGSQVSLVKSYAVTEYLTSKNLNFVPNLVPDDLTALLDVSFGRSDAAVIDLATASYVISQKGITNLRVAGETSFSNRLAMGTLKSEPILQGILQKGLNAITAAERNKIHDKWILSSKKDIFSDWRFWAVVGGSFCVICLLIIGSFFWNKMLRRQVALRTSELAKEQEALRKSESRHRGMVESITDVIAIIDQNGINKYKSPNIEKLFGWRQDEVIGQITWKQIHPDDLAVEQKNFAVLLSEANKSITSECRYQCKDGSYKWIEFTAINLLHDPDISGVLLSYHDITERKKIAEVQVFLAQSICIDTNDEPFFNKIARFLAQTLDMDFVCIDRLEGDGLTARTVAVWCDGHFEDNVSYALKDTPCGDVVGKAVCCFPAMVCQLFPNDLVLKDLQAESYVGVTLWNHNHEPVGLIAVISRRPLVNRQVAENILSLVGIRAAGEIERIDAEDSLREKEALFRSYYELGLIGMAITSLEKGWIQCNDCLCSILGYTLEELFCKTWAELTHPDDLATDEAYFQKVLSGEIDGYQMEKRFIRKDGVAVHTDLSVKCVRNEDGSPRHFVAMIKDTTQRKQADEALWNEKAFLRSLIDSAVDLIYFKDINSVYLGCNRASESFTGLSEREQIGKSDFDFFDKELAEHIVMHDKQVLKGGVAVHLEESVTAADGNRYILDTVKNVILGKDGQPIGLVGISRDITSQKKEEKLAAARLHLIEYSLSHTLDELLTATLDQIEELTGSLIGYFHLLQEDQRTLTLHAWSTRTARDFCKAEGTGSHYDIEKAGVWVDCIHQRQPVIHNDYASLPHRKGMPPGHATVIRELAVPIFRSDKIIGILGIGNKVTEYTDEDVQIASRFADLAWDIAERRQIQDSLTESNELFIAAFKSAPIMITISNIEDGTYLDANQQFLNISEFSREEVVGKTSVGLGWISETDRTQLRKSIQQHGRVNDQEITLHTKSGQTKLCKYWGEVISVAGQKRLLSIALDITEQHKAEQQLHQAQKMESIGSLAGGVAHDFNNMLTVIMGHAQLGLMKSDTNHNISDHFAEIMKTAERSADLTRQLLAFARKQTIAPKIIDLNEVIDGMLKMLRRLIGESIQLTWQPAPGLWRIKADPSQIDQILANLSVNARDAINGTGRITIETRNNTVDSSYCEENPEAVPGDYVHLSVSDDGSGMDKETMDRVFEPFFTTKGVGEGTGLGLATVYGIVKQNNGFINIYSEPGKGTTFTIHLPREKEESRKTLPEAKSAPLPTGYETILLVEDEPDILHVTALLLKKQGYTLLTAGTPSEAVRLAHEHIGEIDLLITDVIMPEMNGKDLANKLQSLNPQLKCLYMSGYTADIIAQHGVLDEGVYFIQKPFSLSNMAAKVREVLDGK